jgi:hypothetical protein
LAAQQRADLRDAIAPLQTTLSYAEQGVRALRFVARHPVLMAGALAITAYIMPKRWVSVLKKGLLPWGISLATRFLIKER